MGKEIELKMTFPAETAVSALMEDVAIISQSVESWTKDTLKSQYYDSKELDLMRTRLTYRIRQEQGGYVATVKSGGSSCGGLHQRLEWNLEIHEPLPELAWFDQTEAKGLLKKALGDKALVPLCSTCFVRYTLPVQWESSQIEVALDHGWIESGNKQDAIREIELELITGQAIDLLTFGAKLAGRRSLRLERRSKYHRALSLAGLSGDKELMGSTDPVLAHLFELIKAEEKFLDCCKNQENVQTITELYGYLKLAFNETQPLLLNQLGQCYEVSEPVDLQYSRLYENLSQGKTTAILLALWAHYEKTRAK